MAVAQHAYSLPAETRLATLPVPIRLFVVATHFVLFSGLVVSARWCAPVDSAVIAALLLVCYLTVPPEQGAAGGLMVFHTPLYYSAALLFPPATVFMGIGVGILTARSLVGPRGAAWKIGNRAATTGLHVASASATATVLKATLALPLAMLIAPAAVLATGLTVNSLLYAGYSSFRYGLPWRAELIATLRDRYSDQAMELVWILPVAVGAVILPRAWWPLLLATSILTTVMNGRYEVAELRRKSAAITRIVGHTLPTDDPAVRDLAEEVTLGVMVLNPDGAIASVTLPCLRVLGQTTIGRNTRLDELCLAEDVPQLLHAIHRACALQNECAVTVRIVDYDRVPRRVRFAFLNRMYDPAIRGLVATVMAVCDGAPATERLQAYVNQVLAAEILTTQEDERTRLAQDLEDVRQMLALSERLPASVPMRSLQPVVAAMQQALRAPAIDDLGLADAVRQHCAAVGHRGGRAIRVYSNLPDRVRFDRTVELTAYRIVQDAVALCGHATIDNLSVSLSTRDEILTAVIEGWPASEGVGNEPLGRRALMLLIARARLVGGTLRTEVSGKGGHRVVAEIPIRGAFSAVSDGDLRPPSGRRDPSQEPRSTDKS